MELFDLTAALVVLCAVFAFINHRTLRLPTTIGIMLISLLASLGVIALGHAGVGWAVWLSTRVAEIEFGAALMEGMLGFLLFAGALHVDLGDLARQKWVVGVLATLGVLLGAVLTALLAYHAFPLVGLTLSPLDCLLFGALISPTDPIAVLGILSKVKAPRAIATKITGESLFNDGIGVVVFLVLVGIAAGGGEMTPGHIAEIFLVEAVGGILYGLAIGYVAYAMLKHVDGYQVEVLITLALVMGGYALAQLLHTSGPLAMVTAGLLIGNRGRVFAMSETTRAHLDTFWELVDEILNAVLFLLIGVEVLVISLSASYLLAGLAAIPMVLLSRFVAVGVPIQVLRRIDEVGPHAVKVLTWGGLRGGISVALALSLPAGPARDAIITVTYAVVVFSIGVQGLTFGPLLRRLYR